MTHSEQTNIDLSVLAVEPAEEYHAKAAQYLSSHQLIDFMICPQLYRKKQLGQIENTQTPAMLVGSATHTKVLEGHNVYEAEYAVGGPINPRTSKPFGRDTNAFRDWCEAHGKTVLTDKQAASVENMADGVAWNLEAVDLIRHGRAEGVVREMYCGMPCQVRIDWTHSFRGIVDLKTTADLTWFENDCKRRRYHNQLAFYQAVLAEVIGQHVPVHIVAIEKTEPFRCGVWRIGDDTLTNARRENEAAITRLRAATEIDHFPTGYEEIRLLEYP